MNYFGTLYLDTFSSPMSGILSNFFYVLPTFIFSIIFLVGSFNMKRNTHILILLIPIKTKISGQYKGNNTKKDTKKKLHVARAEHQQLIIEGLFDKILSKTIITKYSDLLNALEGKFVTNM